jgi:hypothetical protein
MSTSPLVAPFDSPDLPSLAEADAPEGDGDGLAALPDTFDPDADTEAESNAPPQASNQTGSEAAAADDNAKPHKEIDVLPLPTTFDPDEVNEAPAPVNRSYGEQEESLEDLIIASPSTSKRPSDVPGDAEDLSLPRAQEVEDDLESRTGEDAPTAIDPGEERPEREAAGDQDEGVQAQEPLTGEADGDVDMDEEEEEEAAKPPELLQILKALHRQEAKDPEPETSEHMSSDHA